MERQTPAVGTAAAGCQGGPRAEYETGRAAAALEIAHAYQRALNMLHTQDAREALWYREQLRDARIAAGLSPATALAAAS